MLMEKEQQRNLIALTKIKLRTGKMAFLCIGFAYGILLLVKVGFILLNLFHQTDSPIVISFLDSSNILFLGLFLFIVISEFFYRQTNNRFIVFPQDNKSRFLSTKIVIYLTLFWAILLELLSYMILSTLIYNVGTPLIRLDTLSLPLVMLSCLIALLYGGILIEFLSFLGSLYRKFGIYFKVVAVSFLLIIFGANLSGYSRFITIEFLVREPQVFHFWVIGVTVWLIFAMLSFFLNRISINNKIPASLSKRGIAIIALLVVLFPIISSNICPLSIKNLSAAAINTTESSNKTIVLDASHLTEGTLCTVVTQGDINTSSDIGMNYEITSKTDLTVSKSHKLYVHYFLPRNLNYEQNYIPLLHPNFSATLKGSTIYINYQYQNKAILIYLDTFIFRYQFNVFKSMDSDQYGHTEGFFQISPIK